MQRGAVPVAAAVLFGLALLGGCDELSYLMNSAIEETPSERPVAEPELEEVEAELPERPANSIARSETEVITFGTILENREMTREERIKAFENLDPAALQKPFVRHAVSGGPPAGANQAARRKTEPYDWEISAARRRVPVVMYSTAWCGVCRRAKQYFQQQGISFVEHDVDHDPGARDEYLRLNPRRSVPTIKIGEEVIVGFSPGSVEKALNSAARSRLN